MHTHIYKSLLVETFAVKKLMKEPDQSLFQATGFSGLDGNLINSKRNMSVLEKELNIIVQLYKLT